jgi:hypothetical protein
MKIKGIIMPIDVNIGFRKLSQQKKRLLQSSLGRNLILINLESIYQFQQLLHQMKK